MTGDILALLILAVVLAACAFSSHVEFAPEAAVDVDRLYVSYARWCAGHGAPVWAEAEILAWLAEHGATVRTGPHTQIRSLVGVKVMP